MPNFNNTELIKSLSIKDNETENEIKTKIETSYKKFKIMEKKNPKCKIILVDEIPIMTFYMNEKVMIIATYSLISKDEKVPTFLARKNGHFYSFAEKEIEYLKGKYIDTK